MRLITQTGWVVGTANEFDKNFIKNTVVGYPRGDDAVDASRYSARVLVPASQINNQQFLDSALQVILQEVEDACSSYGNSGKWS